MGKLQKWFSKASDKVKSFLPSWASTGTKQRSSKSTLFDDSSSSSIEKQSAYNRQKQQTARDEISSSLDSLFQDSPLGMRLMGNMIVKPLFRNLAGSLVQTMQDQQREMDDLLAQARTLISSDKNLVKSLGGEPIQVKPPFSQSSSSSTVSVSGSGSGGFSRNRMETKSRIEASFEVMGGNTGWNAGGGIATMVAVNGIMERLYVNLQGRYYEVNVEGTLGGRSSSDQTVVIVEDGDYEDSFVSSTTRGSKSGSTSSSASSSGIGKNHNPRGKDDIIDAEFVDKKVYTKKNEK
jgi:hypothetical protein